MKNQGKKQEMKIRPPELRSSVQAYCTAKNDETCKSVKASRILESSNLPDTPNLVEGQTSENPNPQIITPGNHLT